MSEQPASSAGGALGGNQYDRGYSDGQQDGSALRVLASLVNRDIDVELLKALERIAGIGADAPAFGGEPEDFYRNQLYGAIGTASRALAALAALPPSAPPALDVGRLRHLLLTDDLLTSNRLVFERIAQRLDEYARLQEQDRSEKGTGGAE